MYGAKVRLRYAGFVSFFSMLFSVLTGLAFTTIVTRKLTPTDFGFWQVISVTVAYFAVVTNIVGYWTPRFIARGENVAKSSIFFNATTGIAATLLYILLSYAIAESAELEFYYFLLFAPQVILSYLSIALEGVNRGYAPQHVGYSFILFEVTKVAAAYILIVHIKQRLAGALLAVMIAQAARLVYLLAVTYPLIKEGQLKKEHLIRFTKLSWIPIYCNLAGFINTIDVYIITFFAKSTLPVALFRVAYILSVMVFYSSAFASALYPRVLAKKESRDIEETLKLTLMFAVPMSIGLIVLAKPLLSVFGVKYTVAYKTVIVLTIASFIASISRIFETVILGTEQVDLNKTAGIKEYIKSNLFLLPTVQYIVYIGYLATLPVALIAAGREDIVLTWSTVYTASRIVLATWEYKYSQKLIKYRIPYRQTAKYLAASLLIAATLILLNAHNTVEIQIAALLPKLAVYITLGALTYFTVLLAIDSYTREIAKKALQLAKNITHH